MTHASVQYITKVCDRCTNLNKNKSQYFETQVDCMTVLKGKTSIKEM